MSNNFIGIPGELYKVWSSLKEKYPNMNDLFYHFDNEADAIQSCLPLRIRKRELPVGIVVLFLENVKTEYKSPLVKCLYENKVIYFWLGNNNEFFNLIKI